MNYPTIEDAIGKTPLVALQRIGAAENAQRGNVILGKLEGNNPAGSVKDRPALSMIKRAEERGEIKPGDTLIEATSGNTGIALAMAAAIRGYRMVLIMPEDLSVERAQTMKAFGAELMLTPKSGGMEYARDLAENMQQRGQGPGARPVRQCRQPAHPLRDHRPRDVGRHRGQHHALRQRDGHHRHHHRRLALSSRKRTRPSASSARSPSEGSRIPGIRKWPQEYLPKIYDPSTRRRGGQREPGRRRGDVPPAGARRGHLRRHLGRGRLLGRARRSPRRWRTRPSCSWCAIGATATCRPAFSRA